MIADLRAASNPINASAGDPGPSLTNRTGSALDTKHLHIARLVARGRDYSATSEVRALGAVLAAKPGTIRGLAGEFVGEDVYLLDRRLREEHARVRAERLTDPAG